MNPDALNAAILALDAPTACASPAPRAASLGHCRRPGRRRRRPRADRGHAVPHRQQHQDHDRRHRAAPEGARPAEPGRAHRRSALARARGSAAIGRPRLRRDHTASAHAAQRRAVRPCRRCLCPRRAGRPGARVDARRAAAPLHVPTRPIGPPRSSSIPTPATCCWARSSNEPPATRWPPSRAANRASTGWAWPRPGGKSQSPRRRAPRRARASSWASGT